MARATSMSHKPKISQYFSFLKQKVHIIYFIRAFLLELKYSVRCILIRSLTDILDIFQLTLRLLSMSAKRNTSSWLSFVKTTLVNSECQYVQWNGIPSQDDSKVLNEDITAGGSKVNTTRCLYLITDKSDLSHLSWSYFS